ncbi:MAG: DUF2125 domain-containing protein [Rhodobacteraceae bacterium]|nr:DUF2125 domain-containing protein [Paracoccaceae bacterium]
MTYPLKCSVFVLSAALAASAAKADISADEVWQGWVDYYAGLGQTLSAGTKTMQADTLVISDASITGATPDGTFSASLAEIRLRETGDGRVEISMSESIPLRVIGNSASGENVDLAMNIGQSGLNMVVSGSADDALYAYESDRITIAMDGMKVNDQDMPMKVDVAIAGATGSYRMATAADRRLTSDFSADRMDFSVAADSPENGGKVVFTGGLDKVAGLSSAVIPMGVSASDMNAMLKAGADLSATLTYGNGGYKMDVTDQGQSFALDATGEGGSLTFGLSAAGLNYGGEARASQVSVQTSAFPVPVDLSLASSAFNMAIPVSKSDLEQPFSALISLVDLSVSDGLWNMFDPGMQLPRDPATVIIDLSGMARLLLDIMDPANAQALNQQPPGELTALDLKRLQVKLAGAELTGQGALTFDNQGFVPQPLGSVDLQLVGGNGLIDKLVAMGFVPEDQAMGARMMMGLFAVMTGDDTLTSKIEFKEGGAIFANGQRIQ